MTTHLFSVQLQISEMREYFKAFKTQNITHRDYTPYFRPVLCYMEGAWTTLTEDLEESFVSAGHLVEPPPAPKGDNPEHQTSNRENNISLFSLDIGNEGIFQSLQNAKHDPYRLHPLLQTCTVLPRGHLVEPPPAPKGDNPEHQTSNREKNISFFSLDIGNERIFQSLQNAKHNTQRLHTLLQTRTLLYGGRLDNID